MNKPNSKTQHGAVLAFCLVMLLLLTLAATRMIQQNKQQLEMANNSRLVTQEFANAEGLLAAAKNVINNNAAHVDPSGTEINHSAHQCVPTTNFKQNILLAGLVTGVTGATILKVRCASDDSEKTCSEYSGGVTTCNGVSPCTSVTQAIAQFTAPTDICYQDYDPQADSMVVKGKCPREIYTIQIISTDANGTTREIVSDHVVGCG